MVVDGIHIAYNNLAGPTDARTVSTLDHREAATVNSGAAEENHLDEVAATQTQSQIMAQQGERRRQSCSRVCNPCLLLKSLQSFSMFGRKFRVISKDGAK